MRSSTQADYLPVRHYVGFICDLHKASNEDFNWKYYLANSGYHLVNLRDITRWREAHDWATATAGVMYYSWSGNTFYFNRSSDALLFALQFG